MSDKSKGPIPVIKIIFDGENPRDLRKTKLPC